MNHSIDIRIPEVGSYFGGYQPDQNAFDWCVEQHVIQENNMEWYAIGMVGIAYLLLSAYAFLNHYDKTRKYAYIPIQFSRLVLLLYFALAILVIKYRLIWTG